MKNKRQEIILQLIAENDIDTQDEILRLLAERGIQATQATVSRDIKDLRLIKESKINGGYRYSVSSHRSKIMINDKLNTIFTQSIVHAECAQNLLVIKTMSGLANAAAAALDGMSISNILGTIAGDDTVLVIFRENEDASDFCQIINDQL